MLLSWPQGGGVLGGGHHSEPGHRVPPVGQGSGRNLGVLCCWPLLFTCTHTRTLPPLWQAKQRLLYLTGGSCLQPSHHLHVKSVSPAPDLQGMATACAHCLGHQGANSRAECGSAAVMVPGDVWGCGVSLARLGCQGHPSPAVAKVAVTKDTVQEDCPGIEQRGTSPCPPGGWQPPQTHC